MNTPPSRGTLKDWATSNAGTAALIRAEGYWEATLGPNCLVCHVCRWLDASQPGERLDSDSTAAAEDLVLTTVLGTKAAALSPCLKQEPVSTENLENMVITLCPGGFSRG